MMWSLAPAIRAMNGSSWASEPSLARHVPITQGIWDKGKGLTPFWAANAENCHSRQKRTPPEIPSSRQVTAIQVQGDMTARVLAACRESSAFMPNRGRTDIDVMMVRLPYREKILGITGQRMIRIRSHNPSSRLIIPR
jgi:hypothetical protein